MNSWLIKHYIHHFFTANRKGHGVHSPFVYALVENVFSEDVSFYAFKELATIRKQLESDTTLLKINDMGAGSKKLNGDERRVCDIAKHGLSSRKQSEFYFKLINYLHCINVIELGTSLGLNTLYLSMANSAAKIYTIEGSESLCKYATDLFQKQQRENIQLTCGNFDTELPKVLAKLGSFDLLYIDGNHAYEPTLRYFNAALEHCKETSVMVFDDIYWSEDMTKAWQEVIKHPKVNLSIDCFYFGLLFFRKETKQKEHFKIFF